MSHSVFISYAAQDKAIANAVCAGLEAQKIRCWIAPRDLLPGVVYGEGLIEALDGSQIMVILFTSSANASPHVLRELERAASKGIPIIPFRLQDVPLSKSMEYFVSAQHWLDALTPPLEMHIARLADTVKILLTRTRQSGSVNISDRPTVPAKQVRTESIAEGNSDDAEDSTPRYFCYISHQKVDQLLEQLASSPIRNPQPVDSSELQSHLASIVEGTIPYGRPDFVLRNRELRMSYADKLKRLAKEIGKITTPFLRAEQPARFAGLQLFWYRGAFAVAQFDAEHGMTTLQADTARGQVLLHCSLRYFSSGISVEKFPLNSTNYSFFNDKVPMTFETVFMMVSDSPGKFSGSPVYLQLRAAHMVAL